MTEPAQSPKDYLESVLDNIQAAALRSSAIADWDALRVECRARIADAQTTADTYPVIQYVLSLLGDRHSFFRTPEELQKIIQPEKPLSALPSGRRLASSVGYLELTDVITPSTLDAYVAAAHQVIRANSAPAVSGWIVDLRRNTGGNMFPMLAAVGEILGEGAFGAFITAQGQKIEWGYRSGGVYCGDDVVYQTEKPNFGADHSRLPVAVLISPQTASSGEIVAIAFIGRNAVRLFGEPTRGLTTANEGIPLSDGATLILTMAADADRNGKIYDGALIPDETVVGDATPLGGETDPVILGALQWLTAASDSHSAPA